MMPQPDVVRAMSESRQVDATARPWSMGNAHNGLRGLSRLVAGSRLCDRDPQEVSAIEYTRRDERLSLRIYLAGKVLLGYL